MDFFVTGGFQQLFNELNENEESTWLHSYEQLSLNTCDIANKDFLNETFELGIPFDCTSYYCNKLYNPNECNKTSILRHQFDYGVNNRSNEINCNLRKGQSEEFLLPSILDETANLPNTHINASRTSNSNLLPLASISELSSDIEFSLTSDAFIAREMSTWEENFLDNYIEIPELVDLLPVKTPLCTEQCELFLIESSTNLRLHRKSRSKVKVKSKDITIVAASAKKTFDCDKGYSCTFGTCQKIYAKPAHLKAHLRRHLGEKPYICNWPNCTWKFSRSDELARHRRSHSGVKPYKCDYCSKCFARSDHLTKHRKVHERRLLAASKAGKPLDGNALPHSILTVRPGRKRKNQFHT